MILSVIKGALRSIAQPVSTWLVRGPQFKRLAPQAPAATAGQTLRVALPYLIPNLGDAVMVFPLIDALRKENPDLVISVFTHRGSRILGLHPQVDHHYEFRLQPDWRGFVGIASYMHDLYRQWDREWRSLRFHQVVSVRGGVDPFYSMHLGWLLGGGVRTGYSCRVEPERMDIALDPDPLITSCVTSIDDRIHEVERGSLVLELAGLLASRVDIRKPVQSMLTLAHSESATAFVKRYPVLTEPYAIVAPGSSFPRRRWDAERFAEVASRTIVPRGWSVVLVGGPEDQALCDRVTARLGSARVLNLAGKTDFIQLAAICANAKCFLGNDSGTGHVAGACGVPTLVVAMFRKDGPVTHHSSPMRTHPVGPQVRVVQSPRQILPCVDECISDDAHCILGITVDEVAGALANLLREDA